MTLKKTALFLMTLTAFAALLLIAQGPAPVMAHKGKVVDQVIKMTLGDFFYRVEGAAKNAPITVTAGQLVRFVISNQGELTHEMHIGRTANPAEERYEEPLSEMYDSVWLEPGRSAELWVRVPDKPGEWELGCFHEEHYNSGMHATFIIQPKP